MNETEKLVKHKPNCKWTRALNMAVSIDCEPHGLDVCPECDKCECEKWKLVPMFVWYDLWVGFYWDRKNKSLYFFPLPTLGVRLDFPWKPLTFEQLIDHLAKTWRKQ